jgi:hypothetical protein
MQSWEDREAGRGKDVFEGGRYGVACSDKRRMIKNGMSLFLFL